MFSLSVPITGKKGREGLKLVSRRNATQISVSDIPSGKTGLPFRCSIALGNFSAETTQKVVFHTVKSVNSRLADNPL